MKKNLLFTFFAIVMIAVVSCHRPETYIVTFDANGGTGTMPQQEFTEGEQQALTRNEFSRNNYLFSGWNTINDGSGTSYSDSQTITATTDMTLYAQWRTSSGTYNGHNWVDLGLPSGTLWATCNVGANAPEENGDYFAWGETTTKERYNWDNYRYCYNGEKITKYCFNPYIGYPEHFTDNLGILEASDDAATVNWGAGWRTPTRKDFEELALNCTIKYWTQNWIKGIMITSNTNGNTIFLPFAGLYNDNHKVNETYYGEYMSSCLSDHTEKLDGWEINNNRRRIVYYLRCYGLSVRPVCSRQD